MIKLFWNTHNQIIPTADESNSKDSINYKWGIYHKDNSNKWIYYLLDKIKFQIIQNHNELETKDILIIIDSSIEKKNELYTKIRLICSKIFLIHLGDESGTHDVSSIYNKVDFVWRSFCMSRYFKNDHVSCLPIGYKSGVSLNKNITTNKYKWAFIGTPHKSSRQDLLFQLSSIKPSFCYKTNKFNEKIMEANKMSEILSSTDFIPCPNGFVHPETYRLYEGLECECIPIVESAYKYYDRLFPNNPFLKIGKWQEAKSIIKGWNDAQIKAKQIECKSWWNNYKNQLKEFIKNKINS